MLRRELALEQPDPGILRKAQRGDELAFSIIVRAYERPVYNYVLRLVGDRALAEDLTQESFLRIYQGLPGFSLRSRFTTWMFQVTKNRVLDELRALERRPRSVVNIDIAINWNFVTSFASMLPIVSSISRTNSTKS